MLPTNSAMSTTTTTTTSSSRSSFSRTVSMSSVDKSLSSLRASSSKSLRRLSSCSQGSKPPSGLSSFSSPSTESIPVFNMPDYTQPVAAPPSVIVSPLEVPSLKRAMSMPTPMRTLRRVPRFSQLRRVCEPKTSVVSSASAECSITWNLASSVRRRSSFSSIEGFTSTEDRAALALRLYAPSTVTGVFTLRLPALVATKNEPDPHPYEREIALTEEQEENPPRLPPQSVGAWRSGAPRSPLTALFSRTPKNASTKFPPPVDPKTLASDVPLVVDSSPIAVPLPKGPAPTVRPAPKPHKFAVLPRSAGKEKTLNAALCAGW
ncbi:hypothetical protein DFH06DRAFT_1227360 [Mycena polygramma]|nr:hypothetical protein DFH06DRAFT_1227360 [Mycena polygramma]